MIFYDDDVGVPTFYILVLHGAGTFTYFWVLLFRQMWVKIPALRRKWDRIPILGTHPLGNGLCHLSMSKWGQLGMVYYRICFSIL